MLVNADDDLKAEALIINSEKPDRARLLSLQGHGAGALYNSVAYGETAVKCSDWVHGRRVRFGLPPAHGVIKCFCGKDLSQDTLLDRSNLECEHPLACNVLSKAKIVRHNGILKVIFAACNEAGIPSHREPRTLLEDEKRPDAFHRFTTKDALTDVVVPHPSAKAYVKGGSWRKKGMAAGRSANYKDNKYRLTAINECATFFPLAVETYGYMHVAMHKFLKMVASAAVEAGLSHEPAGAFPTAKIQAGRHYATLLTRVSVALLKGNAHCAFFFARMADKSINAAAVHYFA